MSFSFSYGAAGTPSPAEALSSGAGCGPAGPAVAEFVEGLREEIRRRWGTSVLPHPGPDSSSPAEELEMPAAGLAFGCAALDGLLPGGGIPRGALTEFSGTVSCGKTSLGFALAARTLRGDGSRPGERVAWVDPWNAFYAPAAAQAGIPLESLLLVRPPQVAEVFRAGETLLRSAALALLVLDAVGLREWGVTAQLFRLAHLAAHVSTAVVLITDRGQRTCSLGSAVALRLCIERRSYCFDPEPRPPFDLSGYRVEIQVGKTRHGPIKEPCTVEMRSREGLADFADP